MKVGELFVLMAMDFSQYDKDERVAKARVQTLGGTLSGVLKNAFSFTLGIGIIQGFRSLSGAVTDFVNTAARTEVLDVAMLSVAQATGHSTEEIRKQEEALRDLGVARQEAKTMLARFMQAEIDTADATKIARVAQDAAVIAGYNSSDAAEQITEAIAKQRPELLRAFGFTRNLNDIYDDYAKTLGKATKQLTETEKKQAMLNYILKEGEKIAGTYEASMGVVGKIIGSLKRYWDDLKDSIAKPLALPAIGVIVDGITDALKTSINWANANKTVLQAWGQTVANAARTALKWVWAFGSFIVRNWGKVAFVARTVAIAFLSYYSIISVLNTLSLATKILAGELVTTNIILGFASRAFGIYRLQINLASAAGIAHVGVLAAVRTALYSVWAALGPIGWVILGITGLLTAGIYLWNRYTQSLQNAAKTMSTADMFKKLREGAQGAADATEDQADAMEKAGKAAGKNIMAFDEVHQLQEDMAGSAADMGLEMPEMDDIAMPELAGMDLGGMLADIEKGIDGIKPTLAGFWEWIKAGAGNAWERAKTAAGDAWNALKEWGQAHPIITGIAAVITALFLPALIKVGVQAAISGAKLVASWAMQAAGAIKSIATQAAQFAIAGAKWVWLGIQAGASGAKIVAAWLAQKVQAVGAVAVQIAQMVLAGAKWVWLGVTALASGAKMAAAWIIALGPIAWVTAAVIALAVLIIANWDWVKEKTVEIWGIVATWLSNKWGEIKGAASTAWNDIKTTIANKWEEIKNDAFKWGKNLINSFVDGIKDRINSIKSTLKNVADTVKGYLGFSSPTKEGPGRYADEWAPNLMKMYSRGILANVSMVQSAAGVVARSLAPMASVPAPVFAGMGGGTFGGRASGLADELAAAIRGVGGARSNAPIEVVLNIDGRRMARAIIPAIQSEQHRTEFETITRTK